MKKYILPWVAILALYGCAHKSDNTTKPIKEQKGLEICVRKF